MQTISFPCVFQNWLSHNIQNYLDEHNVLRLMHRKPVWSIVFINDTTCSFGANKHPKKFALEEKKQDFDIPKFERQIKIY